MRWMNTAAAAAAAKSLQPCPTLCDPMDCSTPGLPAHHQLLESTQTQEWHTQTEIKSQANEMGMGNISYVLQFSSVAQLCPTLCNPMDCSTPGFPVHHQFPELTQTHVHWVSDAIQPSHPLLSPSPPTFNLSQHQGLFKWVSSSYQVAKVLEFQLQHQFFQWIFMTYFL